MEFTYRIYALQVAIGFDTIEKMGERGIVMNQRHDYIAVFDSGVGGISVLRQLKKRMPNERYLYFGDSANAPYGTKSSQEVRHLALAVARRLVEQGVKALVVACNTATAVAIDTLRKTYPDLIVVGIEPALKTGADKYPGGHIGVMATPVTLEGEKFQRLLERFSGRCRVSLISAPGLADLVEAGKQNGPEGETLLRGLLEPYRGKLDALVLGCTHYPFARETIQKVLGRETELLDGGEGTAAQTMHLLQERGLLYEGPGQVVFQNSLKDDRMLELSRQLYGEADNG